ncbi:hypothetical protein SAMN05444851_0589 [Aliiroseovarius sediminilitoris]|uniref:Regulator RcnB of Ni and Co efflux n=2 Tax=Aliiroseovarius sediminilitoris TaxID=1173584 RepID=A0A1I0N6G6_9RHOB|nr:hypothetical protein SAMN05444851_0589 [Aliiroseovarius sediminilitoris]
MMKTATKTALALVLVPLMATASFAGNGKGQGQGKGHVKNMGAIAKDCPPGLAKKNPPCIPPGHAKPRLGDHLDDYEYRRFTDYDRYRLDPRYRYYRVGEMIYRADPTTFKVLEVIGLMDELLR